MEIALTRLAHIALQAERLVDGRKTHIPAVVRWWMVVRRTEKVLRLLSRQLPATPAEAAERLRHLRSLIKTFDLLVQRRMLVPRWLRGRTALLRDELADHFDDYAMMADEKLMKRLSDNVSSADLSHDEFWNRLNV